MTLTRREMLGRVALGAPLSGLIRYAPTTVPPPAGMQEDLPGDVAIRRYLALHAAELEREFLPGITSAADYENIRPSLRRELLYMLGLDPLPEKTPLRAVVTGKLERTDFTVEKLHFQSLPGLYVTANLYLPRPAGEHRPAILYQCGHYNHDRRDGNKTAAECQGHGIWFATHGYVALVVDTLELSEIAGLHRGLLSEGRWWWHSAGYSPAGVECWNAIRSLDYLASRPEVDSARIGATGISGGGIGTFWIAAVDDRVKASAPVSGIGDLTFYAGEEGISRHCDCFFLYNRARWNWTTICSLLCPRPLLFVNSNNDIYFPLESSERTITRLERLYSLFGAGDQVDAVVSVGGHGYRTDVRRAVFEFFNRHLKGDARRVTDEAAGLKPDGGAKIELKSLRVFPEDTDFPADSINTRIDGLFIPLARPGLPSPGTYESWQGSLLSRLRNAAFAAWPPAPPRAYALLLGSDARTEHEVTEEGIEVYWRWVPGSEVNGTRWLIVLNQEDDAARTPEWARDLVKHDSALYLCTRGVGPEAWTRDKFPNPVERALALLGATVESGRIWDVLTLAGRHSGDGKRWRAAGQGRAGILTAYAALFQPAIEAVVALDPPASHRPKSAGGKYGPPLLNVLRVLDIPEALGCLAPRPLTLINATDPAFDRTAEIYRAANAAGQLLRK